MAKQNLGGVYANMEFPPYVWQEYPKHIKTGQYGQFELAHSAAEEAAILAKLQKEQDDAPAEYVPYVADPQKEILISRARELGIPFNSKWSKTKLQTVVQEAENDVDSLPPEELSPKKESVKFGYLQQESKVEPETEVEEVPSEDLKEALLNQAKSLGISGNAMHLWGVPRLKAAIAEAKTK